MRKACFVVTILLASLSVSFAQSWQDTLTVIDQLCSRYQPDRPGCQLSISRYGKLIYSKAWGMADMERQVPLTNSSIIEAGSVSKQFTAAAVLLLEQQQKLSLQDNIRKYVPELPIYHYPITISQLMHHTSGLRDWGAIAQLAGWPRTTKTYSNADALQIISEQKGLNNIPGGKFIYSNSNYNLLAIIVQRVSGMSLAEFTRKYIFIPAGMVHTQWRDDFKRVVANRALAYSVDEGQFKTEMPNENAYGNGGLLTTTEDLLKWNEYYWSGQFGTPSLLAKLIEPDRFIDGSLNPYGAGLFISRRYGLEFIQHSGATASYRAMLERFPQLGLSIAWLSNSAQFDTASTNLIVEVEKLFIKEVSPNEDTSDPSPSHPIVVPLARLEKYAGEYQSGMTGNISFTIADKRLAFDDQALVPLNATQFKWREGTLDFTEINEVTYINPPFDRFTFYKVDSTEAANDLYLGTYYSDEVKTSFTVQLKNGKLLLYQAPANDNPIIAINKDHFMVPNLRADLRFVKSKTGQVVQFTITTARAFNIKFTKVK
ncbi:serine hydrolase domain-containing protein [Dyadobacter pollutisoli]|uniref:Serine hydrolase n=1 Tax=Dyadobacter pollutisoli TaxID=2910158 RepID=A0A9E8SKI2_9BACT|nr:serine hydrolase domain-containing protein [Dyadobacter pollutisoli]WAC12510.1 serine hydrolase [Dyadobacter pollutisoli]